MQGRTSLANISYSIRSTVPQVTIGTVIQIVVGKDSVCYKIRPDPVNGIQPHDEHGEWPESQGPLPAGARVAFRGGLPGDNLLFPGAVVIVDVGMEPPAAG